MKEYICGFKEGRTHIIEFDSNGKFIGQLVKDKEGNIVEPTEKDYIKFAEMRGKILK